MTYFNTSKSCYASRNPGYARSYNQPLNSDFNIVVEMDNSVLRKACSTTEQFDRKKNFLRRLFCKGSLEFITITRLHGINKYSVKNILIKCRASQGGGGIFALEFNKLLKIVQ